MTSGLPISANGAGEEGSSDTGLAICVRIDRAMRILGIGKTKLYELIATGDLETIHIGRRTLVLRTSIDNLVERLRLANSRS